LADSGALRTQRWKQHKAGDHSLCRRCGGSKLAAEGQDGPPPPAPVTDPIGELRRLAGRLRSAHEADPGNALIARELRMTLQALTGGRSDGDSELESLFAELGAS
jgi:hypothetical protein